MNSSISTPSNKIQKRHINHMLNSKDKTFTLITSIHHGLEDINIPKDVIKKLNCEELMLFSSIAYQLKLHFANKFSPISEKRKKKYQKHLVNNTFQTIYSSFINYNLAKSNLPINTFASPSDFSKQQFFNQKSNNFKAINWFYSKFTKLDKENETKFNPYPFNTIEDRLKDISQEHQKTIIKGLIEQVTEFAFERTYQNTKKRRNNDNHNLEIMIFMNAFPPKAPKQIDKYTTQIAKILRNKYT